MYHWVCTGWGVKFLEYSKVCLQFLQFAVVRLALSVCKMRCKVSAGVCWSPAHHHVGTNSQSKHFHLQIIPNATILSDTLVYTVSINIKQIPTISSSQNIIRTIFLKTKIKSQKSRHFGNVLRVIFCEECHIICISSNSFAFHWYYQ